MTWSIWRLRSGPVPGSAPVVELLDAVDRWPPSTIGTVVSEREGLKLVEIADERGVALDYVSVPEQRLRLIT